MSEDRALSVLSRSQPAHEGRGAAHTWVCARKCSPTYTSGRRPSSASSPRVSTRCERVKRSRSRHAGSSTSHRDSRRPRGRLARAAGGDEQGGRAITHPCPAAGAGASALGAAVSSASGVSDISSSALDRLDTNLWVRARPAVFATKDRHRRALSGCGLADGTRAAGGQAVGRRAARAPCGTEVASVSKCGVRARAHPVTVQTRRRADLNASSTSPRTSFRPTSARSNPSASRVLARIQRSRPSNETHSSASQIHLVTRKLLCPAACCAPSPGVSLRRRGRGGVADLAQPARPGATGRVLPDGASGQA